MWKIEDALPIQLAVIKVEDIVVSDSDIAFQHLLECASTYKSKYQGHSIADVPRVQFARRLFRDIGIDPTKHRPASEALLNRVLKGKQFTCVNTLVDVGNWCALDFLLPTSVYDADKIVGRVRVRKGKEDESYLGLNNRIVNLCNRYLISDELGAFGSPITDSQRTAVNLNTQSAVLLIYAPRHYDVNLLREQADLFSQRTLNICKGRLKDIWILP
jgi:DNA/RNA-binding domain of Phe-tRNA-synthetase-like protein